MCARLSSETKSKAVRTAACVQAEFLKYMSVLYDQDCHAVDKSVHFRRGSRNAMKGSCAHVLLRVILGVCSSCGSAQCLVGLADTTAPTKTFSHVQARLSVNLVCVHCQCFGDERAPVCCLTGCLGKS